MRGGSRSPDKRRRKCLIVAAVLAALLLVAVLALALGLARRQDPDAFQQTFLRRCEAFKGYDCQNVWEAFTRAYVGRDPCRVPAEAYDPLIAAVPFVPACNRMMFWSKTSHVVHDFTEKKNCFITLEDTLLGFVLNNLTWCGKEGSRETFTTMCPSWRDCENNSVGSFWNRASAAFADVACGDVTAMLNGSLSTPFSSASIFGKIEDKLHERLSKRFAKRAARRITYGCKEVAQSRIQECSSNPETPCGDCW
ncbi:hypothetical protein Q5P01_004279 [Channa striata]|uniref:ADP-ribosyl cyclase/cyclic ADP-ribose hydrolase n=1 Tax=Channa striata TaxID=64152 RepID=A0AA88NII2_CHASR|nr:hypothetical protein Q5P01_004279 [Channa striata]